MRFRFRMQSIALDIPPHQFAVGYAKSSCPADRCPGQIAACARAFAADHDDLTERFRPVELGAFRRQRNDGDVCRHDQTGRQVPAGLIDQEDGVGFGRDSFGDFRQVQVHGLGVAGRQDQGGALPRVGRPREDVGGSGALVTRRDGTGTALGPPSRDLVSFGQRGLRREQISIVWQSSAFSRAIVPRVASFLKFSIAPSA